MADSFHGQILDAAVTALQALTLTGITSTNIVQLTVPDDKDRWIPDLPGIIVAPFGTEAFARGTNKSDDIGYPVLIAILDSGNEQNTTSLDARLLWRETILDHFIHNRLGVAGVSIYDQTIEPASIVDQAAWYQKQLFVSALIMRVWARKQRRP